MYITVGYNKKRYPPDEWQFVAYQFLKLYDLTGKPKCEFDGGSYYLKKENGYWILPYEKKMNRVLVEGTIEGLKPSAGKVTIINGDGKRAEINILPSVITPEEFQEMARQIANLAFNSRSFTLSSFEINQHIASHHQSENTPQQAHQTRQVVSDKPHWQQLYYLLEVIEQNLDTVNQQNTLAMRLTTTVVDIKKSKKPQHLIKRKIQPHLTSVTGYGKVYDENSPENQWLAYVVFNELKSLLTICEATDTQAEEANFYLDNNQAKRLEVIESHYQEINDIYEKIKQHVFWQRFDKEFTKQAIKPEQTTKLKTQQGYRKIVGAYEKLKLNNVSQGIAEYKRVEEAYTSGYVHNLSHIYEIWCLVAIYESLLKIGFQPERSLYDSLTLDDNQNLVLPSGTEIKLTKPFANENINITIYYEPQIPRINGQRPYTPDIKIDINAPQRCYGLTNFSVILDAKFKNYKKNNNGNDWSYANIINALFNQQRLQNNRRANETIESCQKRLLREKSVYLSDMIGTAMYKYHYRVTNKPNMSVILHPNKDFLWRGENRFVDFFLNKANNIQTLFNQIQLFDNTDAYLGLTAHKFASLILRPDSIAKDTRRLFTLIFHYHMGLTSLCLGCGRELCEEDEFYVNAFEADTLKPINITKTQEQSPFGWDNHNPSTRFRAVCRSCQSEWRVSFCSNEHCHSHRPSQYNRLVNIGRSDQEELSTAWLPIHHKDENRQTCCPKCGDSLGENLPEIQNISHENDFPF